METPDPKYKHKPSEKHTLEEVLKSLQDLIRIDLSESTSGSGKPDSASAGATQPDSATLKTPGSSAHRETPPATREDFAPVSPNSGPVNLDAVMRSLKDLIGNELNVGDAPKPLSEKPSSLHNEYLSEPEKIEEYIPDELAQLDDDLNIGEEPVANESESTPSHDELSAPEEDIEVNLPDELTPFDDALTFEVPQEAATAAPSEFPELPGEITPELDQKTEEPAPEDFAPLDEELTFEEPLQPAPPPAVIAESTELPGEISPELFEIPGSPPEAALASPLVPEENLAPGTQQDMFFDDSAPRPPESVSADSVPTMATEPASEAPPPTDQHEQPVVVGQENTDAVLPTIEVEESFDDNDYFAAISTGEIPAPASEETIVLDAEISPEPETLAPPVPEAATPPETTLSPIELAGEKITLEMAAEPAQEETQDKYSVDFDSLGLTPPLPEESELSPPETGTIAESESPATIVETGSAPVPGPETTALTTMEPTVVASTDTLPVTEPPQETRAPDTPVSFSLEDIPVLSDVVAPPADGALVTEIATTASEPSLPAPNRAREIVVRAVAKLNVEMRKTGGAGLDTKTILRLQQLIRQELEKGGKK